MDKEYIGTLLQLYFSDEASHQQREALFSELEKAGTEADWEDLLLSLANNVNEDQHYDPHHWQTAIDAIIRPRGKIVTMHPKRRRLMWIPAAAVVLLMAVTSWYLFFGKHTQHQVAQQPAKMLNDIPPGHDGAILTLADGKTIVLDNAPDGKIAGGAVKIGNKVSYENNTSAEVQYNTITTPKGRQFSLVLPDGTQVWLNAASSLTYPTAFIGNERRVTLTGEGYFKVTHDATHPFIVDASHIEVHDLGTEFNINAYGDEPVIQTTLFQGLAEVRNGITTSRLQPGNAAIVDGQTTKVKQVDATAAAAWKEGLFRFRQDDLKTIMRQVSRWYNIDVVYEGTLPEKRITGEAFRSSTLKEMLKILELSGVRFRLAEPPADGRPGKIVITQ